MASSSRVSSSTATGNRQPSSTASASSKQQRPKEKQLAAAADPLPTTPAELEPEQDMLFVILDLNPVWWGLHKISQNLLGFLESVLAFCNAHLVMSPLNDVAIVGVTPQSSDFLYPSPALEQTDGQEDGAGDEAVTGTGKYELLEVMNETVRSRAMTLVAACSEFNLRTSFSASPGITKALCLYTRLARDREARGGARLNARILVVKGAEDNPHQYMSLMNAVFTAQKLQIPIDACLLGDADPSSGGSSGPDRRLSHLSGPPPNSSNGQSAPPPPAVSSSLLQQAADLTSGLYLSIPQSSALLQYLLFVFLPRVGLRPSFTLPCRAAGLRRSGVDFRAACFCHRRLVDIGYVCSVCLSIFCAFSPICSTCHTQFKLQVATPLKRKA